MLIRGALYRRGVNSDPQTSFKFRFVKPLNQEFLKIVNKAQNSFIGSTNKQEDKVEEKEMQRIVEAEKQKEQERWE